MRLRGAAQITPRSAAPFGLPNPVQASQPDGRGKVAVVAGGDVA